MAAVLVDELTGALSRSGLSAWLESLQDARETTGRDYAVAMLDLDHLKTINDVYGHATGDAALRTVARRAMRGLRATDRLFRYGGDEFLILLPGTSHAEAAAVLRRVRQHIIGDPVGAGWRLRVTISAGVASSSENSDWEIGDALLCADQRLYHAKRLGRNAVVSEDDDEANSNAAGFAQTRLYGRDSELSRIDGFLASETTDTGDRVLQLSGAAGAGLSRFLQEAGVRGSIAGRTVRHVSAEAAHRLLHLRALELAYGTEIGADAPAAALRSRLRADADTTGLLILLEGGRHLDPVSHQLLAERLSRTGTLLIECIGPDGTPAFPTGNTLQLPPLAPDHVRNWLSAATAGPLEEETAVHLHRVGRGLPGKIAPLVEHLLDKNAFSLSPAGLSADPDTITRAAAKLDRLSGRTTVRLPTWTTPLIGRNQLIEHLRPTMLQRRLVVLTGEGGIGKTRIAAQLALEVSAELGIDAHWISLRTLADARQLPRILADSLGLEPHDELMPVLEQLEGQERLLVLDEADSLAGSAGQLEKLAAALPQLRLVVTVRQPLRLSGESDIPVPLLGEAAARELYIQAAARQGRDGLQDDGIIGELLAHVGYAPLNIELAAAWSRVFPPAELLRELTETPGLLAAAPGLRPETVRFIDVTRRLMSSAEQEILGTLALIPGSFTAHQAARAAGASSFFLLALLERALLHRDSDRYTVHAAIAERFAAGLQNPGAARRSIAGAWTDLAQEIENFAHYDKSTRGYRMIDTEEPNFRFAIRELLKKPAAAQLWPLVQIMRGYLDVRGRRRDGLELFRAIDSAISDLTDLELRGWVRECIALFLLKDGRLEEAGQAVSEALRLISRQAPHSESLALALNTAGIIRSEKRDDEGALDAFNRSAAIRAELGDVNAELQARLNAVMIHADIKPPGEALTQLNEMIDRCRLAGQVTGGCLLLIRKARLLRQARLGSPEDRLSCLDEAIADIESSGYPQAGQAACREQAETLLELGRPLEAAAAFEQAARWAEAENRDEARLELLARAEEVRHRAGRHSGTRDEAQAGRQL